MPFPFMRLPIEVRFMVYEEVLIAPFPSSPSPALAREHHRRFLVRTIGKHRVAPAVDLLRTSKVINEEASSILYSQSLFVALNHTPHSARIEKKDLSLTFAAAQFEKIPSGAVELGQRFRQKLIGYVARTFKPNREQLPLWLFGGYYIRREPVAGRIGDTGFPGGLGPFPGFMFPAFLRQIGPSNTANIKDLEFSFPHLSRACHDFPLYAEIVRQYIFGLKKLSIRIHCVRCNKGVHSSFFGDDESKRQPDGYRAAFLSEIRLLQKDLPYLKDLKLIFDCCLLKGEFREIESLLLREKLDGTTFDLNKTWRLLEEKLTERLIQ